MSIFYEILWDGSAIEWEFDKDGIRGKGKGFSMAANWDLFDETHLTNEGILLFPQKQLFHWIPKSGFKNNNEYLTVIEYAKLKSKQITYSKNNIKKQ